jgi:hypothetical protein
MKKNPHARPRSFIHRIGKPRDQLDWRKDNGSRVGRSQTNRADEESTHTGLCHQY